jgi:hypothetical protein
LKYRAVTAEHMNIERNEIKIVKMKLLWLTDVSTEVITARYWIIHLKLVSGSTEIKLKRHSLRHFPQFCAASLLLNWHFRFVPMFLGLPLLSWCKSVTRWQTSTETREALAERHQTRKYSFLMPLLESNRLMWVVSFTLPSFKLLHSFGK